MRCTDHTDMPVSSALLTCSRMAYQHASQPSPN